MAMFCLGLLLRHKVPELRRYVCARSLVQIAEIVGAVCVAKFVLAMNSSAPALAAAVR
jgi:hypothetical protein